MNIDLGIPESWIEDARAIAVAVAADIRAREGDAVTKTPASDLKWRSPDEDAVLEKRLRSAMRGHGVLVYHATRLLPHEVDWIRNEGISPLTSDLRERKLRLARDAYPEVLASGDVELLKNSGPLNWGTGQNVRLGQLWAVAPLSAFQDPAGFERLLGNWGGESIYWTAARNDVEAERIRLVFERLNALSSPSIVEFTIDSAKLWRVPDIWKVMVGVLLSARDASNGWFTDSRVPAGDVISILQPGDARWPYSWEP
jgi:hypothetical protein